ncbi:glycoside hydrolase family protein, partial [Salmonella enterica subsp. enterica serovar Infantis]|nr:glycoside hydrolase family protein [Salmonella enterica subsp. enterica serovar Infantis]
MRLTESQASKLFQGELVKHETFVKEIVTVPLDQNEFDALVSFSYNLGPGNLRKLVTPKNRLNGGNRTTTA